MSLIDPIARRAYHRDYQAKHREKLNAYSRRRNATEKSRIQRAAYNAKNKDRRRNYSQTYFTNPTNRMHTLLTGASKRAYQQGLEFDRALFSILKTAPPEICACCLRLLDYSLGKGPNQSASPSLDRIDSNLGYTVENTDVICFRCNRVKNDGTADEHELIAQYIRTHGGG